MCIVCTHVCAYTHTGSLKMMGEGRGVITSMRHEVIQVGFAVCQVIKFLKQEC